MTYLSRIRINPMRRASRDYLANPRAMRSAVLLGVPDAPLDQRVLWRLDSDNSHRPLLYVLTHSKPDWSHLVEGAGWPDADGEHARVADYTRLLTRLRTGDHYAFRVTASPVQNTSAPDKLTKIQAERRERGERRSFRLGHRTAAAQLGWFLDHTARWGFSIPDSTTSTPARGFEAEQGNALVPKEIRITTRDYHGFGKREKGSSTSKRVNFHAATFEGHLTITDTELFTHHLLAGIGPSKAYGCGLITLAPLGNR